MQRLHALHRKLGFFQHVGRIRQAEELGKVLQRARALLASNHREVVPVIFTTDRGSEFTSDAFTGLLTDHGIRISMDGKGCWRGNELIERLWRSISTRRCTCIPAKA